MAQALADMGRAAMALQRQRQLAMRVDGRIVGTGEADFTKGNQAYQFRLKGKDFQLLDVPGIEGHEALYGPMVEEAVARAHLVFYVNGTNKKPEAKTTERIRRYLRRGTQVAALVNVRGFADAYEFDDDRQGRVSDRSESAAALAQTMEVLHAALGAEVLIAGQCVHGLMALSSLALDAKTGLTTLHSAREVDLVPNQRGYLDAFGSYRSMRAFSCIDGVVALLERHCEHFKAHIVETNKRKVEELLVRTRQRMTAARERHEAFLLKVQPHFDHCEKEIDASEATFKRAAENQRRILWSRLFEDLLARANDIVHDHYNDEVMIQWALDQEVRRLQSRLESDWQQWIEQAMQGLRDDLGVSTRRLLEDVGQVPLELGHWGAGDDQARKINATRLDMGLHLQDVFDMASTVVTYALQGATAGNSLPIVGPIFGGIAGIVVGLFSSIMAYIRSKPERIRKAQSIMRTRIEGAREDYLKKLPSLDKQLAADIRRSIDATARRGVAMLRETLRQPLQILEAQCAVLVNHQGLVENMPYGTVQSIQS